MILLYETVNGALVQSLEVDVLLKVSVNTTSQTTDFPVEDGSQTTDHIIDQPLRLEIEAMVADQPTSGDGEEQQGRARSAWELIQEWRTSAALLLMVAPGYGDFDNLLLENVSSSLQSGDTGEVLRFSASLKQVRFAQSDLVPAPARKEPKTKPNAESGTKTTSDPDGQTKERSRSLLKEYVLDSLVDPSRAGGFDFVKFYAMRGR